MEEGEASTDVDREGQERNRRVRVDSIDPLAPGRSGGSLVASIRAAHTGYLLLGFVAGAVTALVGSGTGNPLVVLGGPPLVAAVVLGIAYPRSGQLSQEALICSSLLPSGIVLVDASYGAVSGSGPVVSLANAFEVLVVPVAILFLVGIPAMIVGGLLNAATARLVAWATGTDEVPLPDE